MAADPLPDGRRDPAADSRDAAGASADAALPGAVLSFAVTLLFAGSASPRRWFLVRRSGRRAHDWTWLPNSTPR